MTGIKGENGQHAFIVLEAAEDASKTVIDGDKPPSVQIVNMSSMLQRDELFQEYQDNHRRKVQSAKGILDGVPAIPSDEALDKALSVQIAKSVQRNEQEITAVLKEIRALLTKSQENDGKVFTFGAECGIIEKEEQPRDDKGRFASKDGGAGGGGENMGSNEDGIDIGAKPAVSDTKMQNIINDIYKGQEMLAVIGNGTTMDAVRHELKTGQPVGKKFHSVKAQDTINRLNKRLRSGCLNTHDTNIANTLIKDLQDALSGK